MLKKEKKQNSEKQNKELYEDKEQNVYTYCGQRILSIKPVCKKQLEHKNVKRLFSVILVLIYSNLVLFAAEKKPYSLECDVISDSKVLEKSEILKVSFQNQSDKVIKEFSFVCFLFDSEGNSVFLDEGRLNLVIKADIFSGDFYETEVELDSLINLDEEEVYTVDFAFVNKIVYEDGKIWTDKKGAALLERN